MSRVLEKTSCRVTSSDLYDRGFGEIGTDFLTAKRQADNIAHQSALQQRGGVRWRRAEKRPQEIRAFASACVFGGRQPRKHDFLSQPAKPRMGL